MSDHRPSDRPTGPLPPPPVLPPPPALPPPPVLPAPVERSPLVRPLLVVVGWHVVCAALIVVGAVYLGVISQDSDCGSCPGGPLATILLILVIGPWVVPLLLTSTAIVAGLGLVARWLPWLPMAAAVVVPPVLFAIVAAPYIG